MNRSRWLVTLAGGIAVALAAYTILSWTPQVPADAASIPVARAVAIGQECLPRILGSAGYMDACWDAYRYADADPDKDYYILRMNGMFGPGSRRGATLGGPQGHSRGQPGGQRLHDVAGRTAGRVMRNRPG